MLVGGNIFKCLWIKFYVLILFKKIELSLGDDVVILLCFFDR